MRTARKTLIGCLTAVLVLMMISVIVDIRNLGAEISPAMLATFKSGTVTSVSSTSIGIDRVEYRVKANAEILDHKGSAVEKVFVRSEAKFHLNKDNEIDMMVVKRPQ
jgi:hypothetical protein